MSYTLQSVLGVLLIICNICEHSETLKLYFNTIICHMKLFGTTFFIFLLLASFTTQSAAQEKTVAGLYNDGLAKLKAKDYEGGLALMEEALAKAGPDDQKVIGLAKKNGAVAAYNVGNAKRKAKDYEGAAMMYNKGIENNPSNTSNMEGLARILDEQGSLLEATKAYIDAASKAKAGTEKSKDKKAASRLKRAKTLVGKMFVAKSYADAIAGGDAYLAVEKEAEVHYYVSRSQAESGDSEKAVMHAEQAIALSAAPEDKYFYAHASQLEKVGKNAEAIASYKKITGEKYKAQAEYRISQLGG